MDKFHVSRGGGGFGGGRGSDRTKLSKKKTISLSKWTSFTDRPYINTSIGTYLIKKVVSIYFYENLFEFWSRNSQN